MTTNERLVEAVTLLRDAQDAQTNLAGQIRSTPISQQEVNRLAAEFYGNWMRGVNTFLRALDAAPAEDVSHRMICELNDLEKIQAGEPVRCTCGATPAPAEDNAASLVGFLESLDGLFVALRDAEPSGKGVPITLKALANGLHEQTRIFLARKAPVQE